MSKRTKWTIDLLKIEASKYQIRSDFQRWSSGAYKYAKTHNLLDEIIPRVTKIWTKDLVIAEGKKYSTRKEFQIANGSAYRLARKNGWLDEIVESVNTRWSIDKVKQYADFYTIKKEFQLKCPGGYNYALKHGFLDDLYENAHRPSDNDTIYIWKVVGQFFNGNPVYKIGVTSSRLGTKRIEQVAFDAGFDYELICCEKVIGKATDIERKLHILGEDPCYADIDGRTEFRALSDSALYAAISIVCGSL